MLVGEAQLHFHPPVDIPKLWDYLECLNSHQALLCLNRHHAHKEEVVHILTWWCTVTLDRSDKSDHQKSIQN